MLAGLSLSATLGHGTANDAGPQTLLSSVRAPILTVATARGQLRLEGTTASAGHEAGLLELAANYFADATTDTAFRPGVILAENWESTSSRLLYVLAAAETASAVMSDDLIEIRGVTADAQTFADRVELLRQELLDDTAVVTDIVTVQSTASHDALCRRAFSTLVTEPVSFSRSSAAIRTASFAMLDRIIDFAYDCPQLTIAVAGHTDATGDESWNKQLSLARARSVADYIARGGIDPRRLHTYGAGSAEPIADNATPYGRKQNRRIELRLR